MRILITAAIIFTTIHFIRVDLVEGTIPTLPTNTIEEALCEEETFSVVVTSIDGDTIESLFALYPDPEMSVIERMSEFHKLNPHLKQQTIIGGAKVKLPLSNKLASNCV